MSEVNKCRTEFEKFVSIESCLRKDEKGHYLIFGIREDWRIWKHSWIKSKYELEAQNKEMLDALIKIKELMENIDRIYTYGDRNMEIITDGTIENLIEKATGKKIEDIL